MVEGGMHPLRTEILVLIDQGSPRVNAQIIDALLEVGLECQVCASAQELLSRAATTRNSPIALMQASSVQALDVMFALSSLLSTTTPHAGVVLIVGPEGGAARRVQGLRSGADACLSIPIEKSELASVLIALSRRMNTLHSPHLVASLPRTGSRPAAAVQAGDARDVNPSPPERLARPAGWRLARRLFLLSAPNGQTVRLPASGYRLVCEMFNAADCLLRFERWNEIVSARRARISDHEARTALRVLVSRIRHSVLMGTGEHFPVKAVYGAGYQFMADAMVVDDFDGQERPPATKFERNTGEKK